MAKWRQAVELAMTDEEAEVLTALSRSRTEPASRVSRAAMLLAYRENPSFFAVGQRLRVHHQTAQRCVERAVAYGALAALDDRPRPGKEPTITPEAKAWLVSLACDKAKDHGYPHELWTTRLLARHAREHGPAVGHDCLARLVQGTVCKILGQEEIKPHKVRYYLENRDAEFEQKMAEVLCVYREVEVLKKAPAKSKRRGKPVGIVSYDEKPGIQAIATTAPDLPPEPGVHTTFARDHEYKRRWHAQLAGIDLLTGNVHALVRDRHRSREFIEFLKLLWSGSPHTSASRARPCAAAWPKTDLKPWRKDMWCIPRVDGEYVARMEDVLDLYAEAPDPKRPVVCFDESPIQLIGEVRQPIPARPGQIERYDCEYRRNGTANLFVFLDVHRSRRKVKVTERRAAEDFAACMRELTDVYYPEAERIRVVLDNLSTHSAAALYQTFLACEARRVLRRLEFHYVPARQLAEHGGDRDRGLSQAMHRRIESHTKLAAETAVREKAAQRRPRSHQMGVHNRKSPRQDGASLSKT